MIARSSGVRRPGLLMIASGMRILPTSCRIAASFASRRSSALSCEMLGDPLDEPDDAARVAPRVLVVRLDDVAEQERRALVGLAQLVRLADARLAILGHPLEQHDQRQTREQRVQHRAVARDREREPCRRERRVDQARAGDVSGGRDERLPEHEPLADRARREVDPDLRREREHVHGPARPGRRAEARAAQDEHGAEREPARADRDVQPQEARAPLAVCEALEHVRRHDEERREHGRQQEQHRHEHELRGHARAAADLEPGAARERERQRSRRGSRSARRARRPAR